MTTKNNITEEIKERHKKHLITEAFVIALYEQEQMAVQPAPPALPSVPPNVNAAPTSQELNPENPNNLPPQATQDLNNTQAQQITLDALIEKFNYIRGGKSFTDPEVYGLMTKQFKQLNDQDKNSIYKFLSDTAGIILSTANSNTEPQQNPSETSQETPIPNTAPVPAMQAPGAQTAPIAPTM